MFSAIRVTSLVGANSPVPFEVLLIDTDEGFDSTKSIYTVKSAGLYFMHLSAGIPAYEMLRYTLRNASTSPNILLTHKAFNGEVVTSRDDVQYLSEGQAVYTSSDYTLYSDIMRQSTWSGFNLNNIMSHLIVFRVARSSPYSIDDSYIPFDKLLINIGQGWDSCNNQFVVPRSGIYFLSWSTASSPNTSQEVYLQVNYESKARSFITKDYYNGIDTSSHSLLLPMDEGDKIKMYLARGTQVYSDGNYQTSLTGFLYEPVHRQIVAWTLSFTVGTQINILGPQIVHFTAVLLDSYLVWNKESAKVVIPLDGVYYLRLSGGSNVGQANLVLSVNGQQVMNVMEKLEGDATGKWNLRSRSLIIRLQIGDELMVIVPTGYHSLAHFNDLTFLAFLLTF